MSDSNQPPLKRAEAIEFIAIGDPEPYADELKKLIVPKEEFPIQCCIAYAEQGKGTAVCEYAIQQWPFLTPEIRNEAINTFIVDSQEWYCLSMHWKRIR